MLTGALPVHLPPATASRIFPTCSRPAIVGTAVFAGRIARIEEVGADVAEVEPALFVAVTTKRTVEPIMLVSRPSVVPLAPDNFLQEAPAALQSSHW